MVQERVTDFFINQEIHRAYIRGQFETRFFMGRLRGRVVAPSYPDDIFIPTNPNDSKGGSPKQLSQILALQDQNEMKPPVSRPFFKRRLIMKIKMN